MYNHNYGGFDYPETSSGQAVRILPIAIGTELLK